MSDDKHLVCTVAGILTGATGGGMFGAGLADIAQMPVKGGALLWGGVMAIICGLCGLAIADEREKRPKVTHYRRNLAEAFNADEMLRHNPPPAGDGVVFYEKRQEAGATHTRIHEWPITMYQARAAACMVIDGRPFATSTMAGRNAPLSRSEFEAWRDWLILKGYAAWRNPDAPAQGVELRAKGYALFRGLAALPHDAGGRVEL